MKEKKSRPNWYIAAIHYLFTCIAILLLRFVSVFLIVRPFKIQSEIISNLILIGFYILAIWLGIMSSAGYLTETYVIKDKNKVVNFATIYIVVLSGGSTIIQFIKKDITGTKFIYSLVSVIITSALFYFFSKKYIKGKN